MIKQTAITPKTWVYLGVLWVVALLCYSNAILWMPVVLWLERKNWSSALPRWSAVFSGTIFVAIGYFAFTVFGASGYQTGLQSFGNAQNLPRIVIYTVLSLGRGFLNTLLPYKLAAYYSETSWLNVIGVILFFLSIALFLKVKRRVAFDSAVNSPAGLVFILGVATLIPSFFVINTVESFVWADRYGYSVLAFFAISGASIFQLGQSKKFSAVLICLTLTFPFVIYKNVPLWRDAPTLMKSCALGENSTKCTISFLERVFKTLPCPQYFDVLQNGRRLYAEKQYFYDAEFESDMPFFDSICTGTTFIGNTIDINKQILELNSVYGGVGHVSLAQVLQELQMKNPGPAYEVAKSSYLVSGLEKPNITMLSEKSNNYYLGHIDALCVFAKNPDCLERKKIFVKNFTVQQNQEYYSLGFQQTFSALNGPMMFK